MPKRQVDLLQGTLHLLVLKSLALGPLHGLGVSNRIAPITKGTFNVKSGFPVSGVTPDGRGGLAPVVLG